MEGIGLHDQAAADHAAEHGGHAQGHRAAVLADREDAGRRQARACTSGTVDDPDARRAAATVPIEFRVRAGTLDPVDIPAGPCSYTIGIPWYDDDPEPPHSTDEMTLKSLQKMREYGFTSFSGVPAMPTGVQGRQAGARFHDGRRTR